MAEALQKTKICMIVPDPMVEGGIAAVTSGYYGSSLENDYEITYVQSYCNGSKWKKLAKALKAYREFRKVLRDNPPDLVHIHSSFGPSFYRKLPFIVWSHKRGIPVVNHIHGADFDQFYVRASGSKKQLIQHIYEQCTLFIVLSGKWKERIGEIVPKEKIAIVPNYSVPLSQAEAERLWEERSDRKQVLFLGEIGERKGAYDLPPIIHLVHDKVPDAAFIIGGSGDIEGVRSKLNAETADQVSFPGWVRGEVKDRLLKESNVFLLPSYNEGMPMSILDAMGYALPIVSTTVGGIPQLVRDRYNGRLMDAGDCVGIADMIVELLTSPDYMKQAGMNSLKIVEKKYSLKQHLEALESIYQRALGQQDAAPCEET